jgi:hypothetical protein
MAFQPKVLCYGIASAETSGKTVVNFGDSHHNSQIIDGASELVPFRAIWELW